MSTSRPTSACSYSFEGKLTLSRAGGESVLPFDCIRPEQEHASTKCVECGRFFHVECNERVEGEISSIIATQADGLAEENALGSHSVPLNVDDLGVPHRDGCRVVCFPCKHPSAT